MLFLIFVLKELVYKHDEYNLIFYNKVIKVTLSQFVVELAFLFLFSKIKLCWIVINYEVQHDIRSLYYMAYAILKKCVSESEN